MTAGTFRALRFSKFTGTTERSGAAHFADFRIPFWIDATDGGTLYTKKFALVTAVAVKSTPRMDTNENVTQTRKAAKGGRENVIGDS